MRIARHMSTSSPFSSQRTSGSGGDGPSGAQQRYTVAFEVPWQSVVGMDYMNQLCMDGQVVFEAHHVVKRVFRSVCPFNPRYPLCPPKTLSLCILEMRHDVQRVSRFSGGPCTLPKTLHCKLSIAVARFEYPASDECVMRVVRLLGPKPTRGPAGNDRWPDSPSHTRTRQPCMPCQCRCVCADAYIVGRR